MDAVEVHKLYGLAMGCDPRLESPLTNDQAQIWAFILEDVPYDDGAEILRELYSVRRVSMLQPGDVKEAWVAVEERRRNVLYRIHKIDRYLTQFAADDPPEIAHGKARQRRELLTSLPGRIVQERGLAREPFRLPPPPPPHERRARPVEAATARMGQMPA